MKRWIAKILCAFLILTGLIVLDFSSKANELYTLSGEAHVQSFGDRSGKFDGNTLTLGTTGQSKRLESITINFTNNTGYSGDIQY